MENTQTLLDKFVAWKLPLKEPVVQSIFGLPSAKRRRVQAACEIAFLDKEHFRTSPNDPVLLAISVASFLQVLEISRECGIEVPDPGPPPLP